MDLGTTIVGVVILFLCILPFVIMNRNITKREKQFLKALFNLAERNNSKLTEHELLNNLEIGIDKESSQLFFIRNRKNIIEEFQINLSEIQKCRILNSNRTTNLKNGSYKVIDKLALAFTNSNKNKPETIWEFYNDEYDNLNINGELQLIEKWSKTINTFLSEKKQTK